MSFETSEKIRKVTDHPDYDRLPIRERNQFQTVLKPLLLDEKAHNISDEERARREEKWLNEYTGVNGLIASIIDIDIPEYKNIRKLILAGENEEASRLFMDKIMVPA